MNKNFLKNATLIKKVYNKLFNKKDNGPFFETAELVKPINNGVVANTDVEEWDNNTNNIFQNLSEDERIKILKLFATKE